MPRFEKKVDYGIDFEEPIFTSIKKDTLTTASTRIFKHSALTFNFIVKDINKIKVVYLYFIIDQRDIDKFKTLTVSDIKNIIYNKILNTKTLYQSL